jgi:hypothetical protein
MKKNRVLLFLSANRFHGHVWKDGAWLHEQFFDDNQEGREQFALFLQTWRAPVYLLTDLIEEDFHHETVIHLRGKERAAQIQRKFEQLYRSTPFRQAFLHQRQKEGRRDDEMLFSALTNPAIIQTWLDIILQQQAPLAGIYSVPGISKPLVENVSADHILLLTWEKNAGLRQTYFNSRRLYLSRLTPTTSDQTFSDAVAPEVARTQQYLKSLSLLPLGQTLQVHIVCHADSRRELEPKLHGAGDISFIFQDIHELGASLKSQEPFRNSDATRLFLHLLASHPPDSHYASREHTHFFELWRNNIRLFWLGSLIAVAGLLWSGANMWQGSQMNEESAKLDALAQQLAQHTRQMTQSFSSQLAPPADMKSAVTSMRKLNSYSPPPEEFLAGLGATLENFPRISLDHLLWQTTGGGNAGGNTAPANPAAPIVTIDGTLEGWDNNYRGSLAYLDRLQQALKQHHYGVTAKKLPIDVSSRGSIAGNVLDSTDKPAGFTLQLTWEPAQ